MYAAKAAKKIPENVCDWYTKLLFKLKVSNVINKTTKVDADMLFVNFKIILKIKGIKKIPSMILAKANLGILYSNTSFGNQPVRSADVREYPNLKDEFG